MSNLKLISIFVISSIYMVGCTDMDFAVQQGSEALRIKGAVKIENPAPMTVDKVGVFVEGTCTKGRAVTLSGLGSGKIENEKLDCKDGFFSANITFSDGDGIKNVVARQDLSEGGNGAWAQDDRDFLKDTIAPAIAITNPTNQSEVGANVTISGRCENGLNVVLYLTGVGTIGQVACNGGAFSFPYVLPGTDGTKNIVAQQIDIAGNQGSDNKSLIKDTVAPAVAITAPAANAMARNGLRVSGTCENGYDVTLSGGGMAGSIKVSCSSGQFAGDITYSAADGKKNVVATQTDRAGNTGNSNRDFMRDSTPPAIKITAPVAGTITRGPVQVAGTCETGLPVVISGSALGGGSQTLSCSAGQFAFNLTMTGADGTRQIIAAQSDAVQNMGSDQTTVELDATAPRVTITAPAENYAAVSGVTVSGNCESGLEVVVTGTGIASSVKGNCLNSAYSIAVNFSNGDGTKNVVVSQTDRAGNSASTTRNFVRDSTAPVIAITNPAPNFEAQTGIRLQGNCENGINVEISGAGVAANTSTACTSGRFDSNITFSNGDGVKTVIVSQRDNVGNITQDQRNFIRDTIAPVIKISAPAENSSVREQITLTGSCETGLSITISGAGIPASVNTQCNNNSFSQLLTLSSGDGTKAISVAQTDNAGNRGTDSRSFIKDTVGPAITITSPAANTVAFAGVKLLGTCENNLPVALSGAGLASPSTTVCSNNAYSVDILFTAGDGTKNIIVSQTDGNGNTGSDNRNFIRDTTAPVVRILSPTANSIVKTGFTLAGSCETGINVAISGSGVAATSSVACNGNSFSAVINLSAGDGTKNIVVTQTDSVGNSGSDNRDFTADSIAPVISITSPADNSIITGNTNISGTCETGLNVSIAGSGVASTVIVPCNSGGFTGAVTFTAGDGSKVVSASQTDAAGNRGSAQITLRLDSGAPVVTIDTPAANTAAQNGVTMGGACETGLTVGLSGSGLASPSSTTCSGGRYSVAITFTGGDGAKNIIAAQMDAAGNVGSGNRDFVKDTTAPVVAITAPAADSSVKSSATLTGTCETGISVAISGSGVASPINANCQNGGFSASVTFTSGDGVKNVVVAQTDAAGNRGSDNRNFNADTTAPVVAITAPADNAFVSSPVTISGTCETGLSVTINGAGISSPTTTPCNNNSFSGSVTLTAGDGNKVVTASQTDANGNVGSSTKTYRVDTGAPVVTIDTPAVNTAAQSGLTIGGACETGLTVNLSGTGLASPSTATCTNARYSVAVVFSNGDGAKNIVASQTDSSGNTGSGNRDFIRDTTAPVIAISAPAANTVVKTSLTISGTCETGLVVNISGAVGSPSTTTCTGGAFSANITLSNGEGVKNIVVSQTDAVGNKGSDNRNFNADMTAPVIAITSPVDGSLVSNGEVILGTCETGLTVTINGAGIASAVATTCNNGSFSSAVNFTAGDGNKVVVASQTDAVGNSGNSTKTYRVDTGAPVVTIDTPAANTTAQNGLTIGGACETGIAVVISGAVNANLNATCSAGRYSAAITFSNGEGTKNIVATQTDAAGNSGSANRDFVRDTVAPAVAITSPAANTFQGTTFTLSGTCESGLNVAISGGVASVNATCTNNAFSVSVTASAGDGTKTVTARQTDAAGNVGSDSKQYNVDTTAPIVKITAPASSINAQTGLELRGTCETGLEVVIYGPGVDGTVQTPCLNSAFVENISFSIGEGPKVVNVAQTDNAGNMGTDSRTFQKDVTAPAIAFTLPVEGSIVKVVGVNVQGNCETGLTVNLLGSGLAVQSTTACTSGKFSANVNLAAGDGDKNIIAYQTDAAGNNGSAILNLVLDSTAPIVKITGPAAGSSYAAGVTVVGTCESGIDVVASGAGVASNVTGTCTNSQFSIAVLFSAGDGTKNVVVTQTDRAGNLGTDNRSFNRLSSSPVIKITAPAAGTRDAAGVTLQGTCESGLTVNISGDVSSPSSTSCSGSAFSAPIVFAGADGMKTIVVSQTNAVGNTGSDQRDFIKGVVNGFDVFNVTLSNPRVDILFLDDNSSSMEKDQLKLGQKFSSFITGLNGVDWQIGVTTTDCSTGPYGICGSLLPLTGATGKVLSTATPNYEKVFLDTVYRPETVGCQARGDCPSSNEQALFASMTAMDKRASDNAGFFRNDSDLAIVVLSDEDEKSNGPPSATQAQTAQDHFKGIWPSGKKLSVYGIIIQPGDKTCLDSQVNEGGGFAFYGTLVDQWSKLTGGLTGSICDADYSSNLQNIGRQVRNISDSVELSKTPLPGTVQVVFTPTQNITWTVQGNRVLFSAPPPVGTRIEVYYDYQ